MDVPNIIYGVLFFKIELNNGGLLMPSLKMINFFILLYVTGFLELAVKKNGGTKP